MDLESSELVREIAFRDATLAVDCRRKARIQPWLSVPILVKSVKPIKVSVKASSALSTSMKVRRIV